MRVLLVLLIVSFATSCAVGPEFEPPAPGEPARWSRPPERVEGVSAISTDAVDERWWASFDDPILAALIDKARSANPDLHAALIRVAQSRAQRRIAAGARGPSISASGLYQRQRQSEFGAGTRIIDAVGVPAENREVIIDALSEQYDLYQIGFDASWELDFWGRVRRSIEAAEAAALATEEDLHAMRLSVTAEVARTYFELRGAQEQERIATADVAAGEDALHLAETRAAGGLVTQLDVVSQQARLAEARARVAPLQHRRMQLTNALAVLVGETPGALDDQLAASVRPAAPLPAQIAIGVPGEAARRRPDIRSAEARLHAATAEIGVAVADLYPRVTLTAGFLSESLDASTLDEWGARQWAIGPRLQLPLFDNGRRRASVELRELQQQEAAVRYQRTVLNAWREIDDAIGALQAEQKRRQELATALSASEEAHELASVRYQHGLTNFLVALDAERTLLQSRRAYSESETALHSHLVALYKALGGGWTEE